MTDFGPDHLPYGVFSTPGSEPRVGVRLGDGVIDLAFETGRPELAEPSLNAVMAQGPAAWAALREEVTDLVSSDDFELLGLDSATLHLPFAVADYVDFYCSEHHASNVGRIFRPSADADADPLLPNWRHLPVGYHGRAGSVVVSGTPVRRPSGQVAGPSSSAAPAFAPTAKLDLEAELGFVVGAASPPGSSVSSGALADHVFGVVGLNDWSARDVQSWEYRPLGPFLGKSFATSISAWVTPLAALSAAWVPLPGQSPTPLPHLAATSGLDVSVEVLVDGVVVSRPPYASTYWSPGQMLAHLTSNGAPLRTGDLFASGTISGPSPEEWGSLLELTRDGAEPLAAFAGRPDADRTWLRDGDEVTLRYSAPAPAGGRLTLGEVTATVEPAGVRAE